MFFCEIINQRKQFSGSQWSLRPNQRVDLCQLDGFLRALDGRQPLPRLDLAPGLELEAEPEEKQFTGIFFLQ